MFVVSESPLKHLVSQNQTHSSFFLKYPFLSQDYLVALLPSQKCAVVVVKAFYVLLIALILLIVLPFLRYDYKRPYIYNNKERLRLWIYYIETLIKALRDSELNSLPNKTFLQDNLPRLPLCFLNVINYLKNQRSTFHVVNNFTKSHKLSFFLPLLRAPRKKHHLLTVCRERC